MQGKLASPPHPVAEAATRLLAMRLPLEGSAPTAAAIREAVVRSGVFLEPPSRSGAPAQPDTRSALLQLRAGLLALLEGGEIAPVAPVSRRPPPPMRHAQPRGLRGEAPSLPDAASPREAARTLLHQTDGALSRLKLTQLASQPPEGARAAALPATDFIVELPMLLGQELSLAQLQVQRDAEGKGRRRGERGWRVRFAVSFSVIGEVGAQISLLGSTANVALWAAEEQTAQALEAMLPELKPALEAKGLTVGALGIRRGVPQPETVPAAGRLMDRTG